ncbi:MAG: hypothetical protein ABSC94_01185 [Polyangiaceae bacterium]
MTRSPAADGVQRVFLVFRERSGSVAQEAEKGFLLTAFDQELLFFEAEARTAIGEPAACLLLDHFAALYPTSLFLPRVHTLRAHSHCRPATP